MIRIAIVDEQTLFREMLCDRLEQAPGFAVVLSTSLEGAMSEVFRLEDADLLVVDPCFKTGKGLDLLAQARTNRPSLRAIILSESCEERDVSLAIAAGANGYVLKDISLENLILSLRAVGEGLDIISSVLAESVRSHYVSGMHAEGKFALYFDAGRHIHLDAIDEEIIGLIAQGRCNKEIAKQINYSEGSVKNRISRLLSAISVRDRTHLVVFAMRNGLVHDSRDHRTHDISSPSSDLDPD
ncbi:MAG TPA: response regulator transcription factor [Rectinemataceae bacterium]|nr:response regulator transcription factor [Rectinemataceae bacterium]